MEIGGENLERMKRREKNERDEYKNLVCVCVLCEGYIIHDYTYKSYIFYIINSSFKSVILSTENSLFTIQKYFYKHFFKSQNHF